jgi:hypothetical protein
LGGAKPVSLRKAIRAVGTASRTPNRTADFLPGGFDAPSFSIHGLFENEFASEQFVVRFSLQMEFQ